MCIAAGFLHGGTSSNHDECKAGKPVGAEIVCNYQCRKFPEFNDVILENCYDYLDNATHYFLGDTPWLDEVGGPWVFSSIGASLDRFNFFESNMCHECGLDVVHQ